MSRFEITAKFAGFCHVAMKSRTPDVVGGTPQGDRAPPGASSTPAAARLRSQPQHYRCCQQRAFALRTKLRFARSALRSPAMRSPLSAAARAPASTGSPEVNYPTPLTHFTMTSVVHTMLAIAHAGDKVRSAKSE